MIWLNKYEPKTLKEIEIDSFTLNQLKKNVQNKIPSLVHGPVGSGKTSLAHMLARELDYEIIEINASDTRNADFIETIVKGAIEQQSLFKKGKIILIDEIDNTSGMNDRGGIQAITKLLKDVKQPIIFTANNPWDSKLKNLRKLCSLVELKEIDKNSILKVLKKICENEHIDYEDYALNTLIKKSRGDLRAAIIDLQILSENTKELKMKHVNLLEDREREENIIELTQLILKTKELSSIFSTFDKVESNFDECTLWLDENLPLEYAKEDLPDAYNYLSKSDVFKGRISKNQYWRFLVYQKMLMSGGIALSKKARNGGFVRYKRPSRILKLYLAKIKNAKRKSMAETLSEETYTSTKKVLKDTYPYLKSIYETDV